MAPLSSTYFGGTGEDYNQGASLDAAGNMYAVGGTKSGATFPATVGTCGPSEDAVVLKVAPTGALTWARCLGGGDKDYIHSIITDAAGNVFVSGVTWSTNFPTTTGAYQTALRGSKDVFITKLSAAGAIIWSTYLGGSGDEGDRSGLTLDGQGNLWLVCATTSTDAPTTAGAYQRVLRGPLDGWVMKLSPDGRALLAATYLGGSGTDNIYSGIAIHLDGAVIVSGRTDSVDFPTTPGAFQPGYKGGGGDGIVAKLSPTLSSIVWATYIGGTGEDWISENHGFTLDPAGRAILAGMTGSTDFPISATALQKTNRGGFDTFVAILSADGATLQAATYLGGSGLDLNSGVSYDNAGHVYVTGDTASANFPVTANALQATVKSASGSDAFVSKLAPDLSSLAFSTYLGGTQADRGRGIAVDRSSQKIVISGDSWSDDFPTTAGAPQRARANGNDYVLFAINPGTQAGTSAGSTAGDAQLVERTGSGGDRQAFTSDGVSYRVDVLARGRHTPVALAPTPDGRLFVAEKAGMVVLLDPTSSAAQVALSPGALGPEPVVLHDLVLHPRFSRTRFVFLLYTALDPAGAVMRLVRLREINGTLGEPAVLLDGLPASRRAPTGAVTFGRDGRLYLAVGEDAEARGVTADPWAGQVLRLNDDGTPPREGGRATPVVAPAGPQPVSLEWNPVDGSLWVIARGEADRGSRAGPETRPGRVLVRPGAAAARVYRGAAFPAFRGNLFIATREAEQLERWRFDPAAGAWQLQDSLLAGWVGRLESVAEGPDALLYVGSGNSDPKDAVGRDVIVRIMPDKPVSVTKQ